MQNILSDKPYRFLPPGESAFWPAALSALIRPILSRKFGVERLELRGLERLRASLAAGHGILLAPNHCRPCDPLVVAEAARQAGTPVFVMGSAHLFMQNAAQTWVLRSAGVFPIYREGLDKAAMNAAIDMLENPRRPLVMFPEGIITRTNDRLNFLMDGVAFVARMAAKRRAKRQPPGEVVVHPVALRYYFRGALDEAVAPALEELERRLSWRPQKQLSTLQRVYKLGEALLGLKEMEYLGKQQEGPVAKRVAGLIDHVLVPLEKEWLAGEGGAEPNVAARVKKVRMAILPDMIKGELPEEERARRWRQLADTYLAQQLYCYPPEYVASRPTPERVLETIEKFEEDLTDSARTYRPLEAVAEIGAAIPVGESLMGDLERGLKERLALAA